MSNIEILNELKFIIDSYLKENLNKLQITKESHLIPEQVGGDILIGGKVPKSKRILPPISTLKSDSLSKYGYKLSKSPIARHRALKKAARSRGTLAVLKRVNLIGNYSKSVPDNYDKLRSDVEFLKDEYAKEKLSSYKKKRPVSKKSTKRGSKKSSKRGSKKSSK